MLLSMLEAVDGGLCLLEALVVLSAPEVLEVMRRVLLCMLRQRNRSQRDASSPQHYDRSPRFSFRGRMVILQGTCRVLRRRWYCRASVNDDKNIVSLWPDRHRCQDFLDLGIAKEALQSRRVALVIGGNALTIAHTRPKQPGRSSRLRK